MRMQLIAGLAASCLLAGPMLAQQPQQDAEESAPSQLVASAFQDWQAKHSGYWQMRLDKRTGTAQFLYGGAVDFEFRPTNDAEWAELGRIALDETSGMFGIVDSTLKLNTVKDVNLSRIGSSDKVAVVFDQEVNGVPVWRGSITSLFDTNGRLLAVQANALAGVESLGTTPALNRYAAATAAQGDYTLLEGREATEFEKPELVIYGEEMGKAVQPRLAWAIEMRTPGNAEMVVPSGRRMFVDALNGNVLGNEQLIHHQVSGTARALQTPGTLPDHAGNPPVIGPVRWAAVTSSQGNTTTDANGDFSIGGAASTNVTVSLVGGTYATIADQQTGNHSATQFFTAGVPANIDLNSPATALITGQVNAFERSNDFHVYVEGVDPLDTSMSFQILCNTNLTSTCNAFYNGSSVNFYAAGGGCVNTAFSSVVGHEIGHWANDVYGTGNGSSGIGEGMADVWSMFMYDDPIVGEDFFGQGGGNIRNGLGTRQWCGTGCYGQVHADGEVIMGALWKARRNMNTTLGNAAGDAVSDALNLAWFQVYNQTVIDTVIEDQWLALDDDDGNLANGTPNFNDINDGFLEQGFPGVDLPTIDISHTDLLDTTNEAGPYVVDAVVSSLVSANITSVEIKYSVDGGATQTVAMSNTGGDNWSGNIPGQISPAEVNYRIEADDDLGNSKNYPGNGSGITFFVGIFTQIFMGMFDGGGDGGWTHAQIATQDDWMRGTPNGASGDPSAAFTPPNVWGNDLAPSGFNGAYQPNVHNYLESPNIDCSGNTGVKVRFKRWLGVESAQFDQANVLVNGNNVWQNPFSTDLIDNAWIDQTIDISAFADNNANVRVRFEMISDGGVQFGGWNLDNFEVFTIAPVGGPVTDTIALTGPTSAVTGQIVQYSWTSAPSSSPYWFYLSKQLNGTTINGQPFDIGPNLKTLATGSTSPTGTGSYTSPPIPNRFSGVTAYLEVRSDDTGTTFDSNFIQLDIL